MAASRRASRSRGGSSGNADDDADSNKRKLDEDGASQSNKKSNLDAGEGASSAADAATAAPLSQAQENEKRDGVSVTIGGGYGFDSEPCPQLALWGIGSAPPVLRNERITKLLLEGREMDRRHAAAAAAAAANSADEEKTNADEDDSKKKEGEDAKDDSTDKAKDIEMKAEGDKAEGDKDDGKSEEKDAAEAAEGAKPTDPTDPQSVSGATIVEKNSVDNVGVEETKEEKERKAREEEEKTLYELVSVRDEARRYIEGFTSLVTWIVSLPDDPANPIVSLPHEAAPPSTVGAGESIDNALVTIPGESNKEDAMEVDGCDENEDDSGEHVPHRGLSDLVKRSLAVAAEQLDPDKARLPDANMVTLPLKASIKAVVPSDEQLLGHHRLRLPPSSKPELLQLSFPLLVHTYCELLSARLEQTARAFFQTYRHLYEASHPSEMAELSRCDTTALITGLSSDVAARSAIQSEIRLLQQKIENMKRDGDKIAKNIKAKRPQAHSAEDRKKIDDWEGYLVRFRGNQSKHEAKVEDMQAREDQLIRKLDAMPFLRNVRTMKWKVTVSTSSFEALSTFVSSRDELLPMSALLQSRCNVVVERRDPLPFCPPSLLVDGVNGEASNEKVRWAAPLDPVARAIEAGEDVSNAGATAGPQDQLSQSILIHSEALPYPKYRPSDGDDSNSKSAIEFNRALLVNGFRRLEALELKTEYEAGMLAPKSKHLDVADALEPSILLSSICSSSPMEADAAAGGVSWIEPNIGVTSASISLPDGRRVAAGCDDAAVRIFSLQNSGKSSGSPGEPSMVLLGHKNGFPVFDVDWTRDGRTLLSAGGDSTVRLWDSQAVGPYGRLSNVTQQTSKSNATQTVGGPASTSLSTVVVPGAKSESLVEVNGAALAVYRGHAPSTPVWSVSSSPSGYYFASAGSDYTARIWTTDRTTPVRILSGHVSPSVNCVTWHPNCNYVVTASDDKTCRMWDIQTGRCVRLLTGSTRGLNLVRVSPSGKFAAGAGLDGTVYCWDLGSGRLVNQFRDSEGMVNALSFSACGAGLAVSGEDCSVKIWDVRGSANNLSNPDYFEATRGSSAVSSVGSLGFASTQSQIDRMPLNERIRPGTASPVKTFGTNNISVLDLKYTKRNLLLAVGRSN